MEVGSILSGIIMHVRTCTVDPRISKVNGTNPTYESPVRDADNQGLQINEIRICEGPLYLEGN